MTEAWFFLEFPEADSNEILAVMLKSCFITIDRGYLI